MVKNPPAMWETRVGSLGWEDPLEKGMAAHSRESLMDEEPSGAAAHGVVMSRA